MSFESSDRVESGLENDFENTLDALTNQGADINAETLSRGFRTASEMKHLLPVIRDLLA